MPEKLTWGILGTGNIARQFCTGLVSSRRCAAAAVGSRRLASAEQFAAMHRIPAAHGGYQAVIDDPNVQAVYVSLPNSLHHQWAIAALKAGKHVLCEKPLAMNADQAREMFEVAQKAGKVLVEAFMYRSHPLMLEAKVAVDRGEVGKLRIVRSSFCYRTRRIDGNVRFDKPLGGGGLLDIGCYCINLSRYLAGREPTAVCAMAQYHSAGVDEVLVGTMKFGDAVLASFTCGMTVQADNTAYFCGDEGYIEIPVPWKPLHKSEYILARSTPPRMDNPSMAASAPPKETRHIETTANLYALEADDFAVTVLDGKPPRISREDSVGNMVVLDEMRRQIGLEF